MYEYISGRVEEISPTTLVLDCGGIGYNINISLQTFTALSGAENCKIYTHQYLVRDDLPTLYGFFEKSERELFRMLISVSGVGGGTARMILSTYPPADLISIISTGNSSMLKCVKGLGAKTSEKVIVELRDKVGTVCVESGDGVAVQAAVSTLNNELYEEAVSALIMLGFNKNSSGKVVKSLMNSGGDLKVEDIIRQSLKML